MQNFSVYFVAFDFVCLFLKICIRQNAEFCIFDFSLYFDLCRISRNSAFGNAEFQNTVSTERTRKFLRKNNLELKYINANYIFSFALKSRYIAHRS